MPNFRRIYIPGGTYFFTVVTYNRIPIFHNPECVLLLKDSINRVNSRFPFQMIAYVILPDHLHMLWQLPEGDSNFSIRWNLIKGNFSKSYHRQIAPSANRNAARIRKREATIWQRRFWDDVIRNETHYQRCLHYIHINPVKHKLARKPIDWPWSSFPDYVKNGMYEADWGKCG